MSPETNVRGLIPIVLGVVGHRNISPDAVTALESALGRIFDDFDQAYPHSPKMLLSSLAPGADQLAARIAVNRTGWSVRAPLPFEPDVFKQSTSFQTQKENQPKLFDEDGLKQFDGLQEVVDWFVVPMPPDMPPAVNWARVARGELGEAKEDSNLRHACYANAGGYIVRHSHTLIALWDGSRACDKPAGTDEIVRFKLGGVVPSLYPRIADEPLGFDSDRGPVIVLHAPRSGIETTTPAGTTTVLVPTGNDDALETDLGPSKKRDVEFGVEIPLKTFAWRKWRLRRFWERTKHALHLEARRHSRFRGFWEGLIHTLNMETGKEEYNQFLSICQNIDDFNREARSIPVDEPVWGERFGDRFPKVDRDVEEIFPQAESCPKGCLHLRSSYRNFLDVRETADHRAGKLAPVHEWTSLALFVLLFLALLSFHYYAHPVGNNLEILVFSLAVFGAAWVVLARFKESAWWMGLAVFVLLFLILLFLHFSTGHHTNEEYPTILLGVFGAVWGVLAGLVVWAWWVRLDDRRLDYRALTEALRVRRAWTQGGIGRSVASSYLRQLRSEMVWVRRALQHLCLPPEFWEQQFNQLSDHRKIERLQVCKRWIQEQEKQHDKARKKEQHKAFLFRTSGFCIALVGLIVLACLWGSSSRGLVSFLLVTGSLLIIMGGLLIAFCERRAHEELSKQYERMHMIYRSGWVEFARALEQRDIPRAQAVLTQLGHEAIQENAQWLILRRSRPLELPLGA